MYPSRAGLAAAAILLLATGVWIALTHPKSQPEVRRITTLAPSPNGRWLATGTAAGRVCVWDQKRAQTLQEIREDHGELNDLRFSPDGRQLAVANGNLTLVSIGQPGAVQVLRDDQANYGSARFAADGHAILVVTGQGVIEVIEIVTERTSTKMCCSTIYGEVAFGPDEALVFSAGHWPGIWDAQSGRLVTRLTKTREFYTFGPIAFDASRSLVYMGSQDGRVYAWDLSTLELRGRSPPQSDYVNTISVMGRAGWVAYAAFGGSVRIWNPETGETREVRAARTTSNILFDTSSNLTMGTEEGNVESWDLVEGKIRQSVTCRAR